MPVASFPDITGYKQNKKGLMGQKILLKILLLVTKLNDKSKVTQNLIQYFQKLGVQKVFYYASIVSA